MKTIDKIPADILLAHPAVNAHVQGARQALQDISDATTAEARREADERYVHHAARVLLAGIALGA